MKNILAITLIGASLIVGNACAMDQTQQSKDWGHNGWLLKTMPEDKFLFINPPTGWQSMPFEEKRKHLGFALENLTFVGDKNNPESVTVDFTNWKPLSVPSTVKPGVLTRLIDPVTLSVGVLCIIGTYVATKQLGSAGE